MLIGLASVTLSVRAFPGGDGKRTPRSSFTLAVLTVRVLRQQRPSEGERPEPSNAEEARHGSVGDLIRRAANKTCPRCAEDIKPAAAVFRFSGLELQPAAGSSPGPCLTAGWNGSNGRAWRGVDLV